MPKYGKKKHHTYFSKKFIKYMISLGYHEENIYSGNHLVKFQSNGDFDSIVSYPTVGIAGDKLGYRMKFGHSYLREISIVESRCKEILSNVNGLSSIFPTLLSRNVLNEEFLLSKEGADLLFCNWKLQYLSQILENLRVFDDIIELNILYNYPEISKKKGYDKIVEIDNFGIKGEVRSLVIASIGSDDIFFEKRDSFIERYNKGINEGYPDEKLLKDRIEILNSIEFD